MAIRSFGVELHTAVLSLIERENERKLGGRESWLHSLLPFAKAAPFETPEHPHLEFQGPKRKASDSNLSLAARQYYNLQTCVSPCFLFSLLEADLD